MPPRARSKKSDLVIGVAGVREAPDADIKANLEDVAKAESIGSLLVLVSDPLPESMLSVLDWADDNKIPYDVVTDGTNTSRDAKGVQRSAREVIDASTETAEKFVTRLAENDEVRVLLLWDAELAEQDDSADGHSYDVLEAALAADLDVCDLTRGNEPLTIGGEPAVVAVEEPEPEPEPAAIAEPEQKRRTRRTKAQIEADNAAAAAAQGGDEAQQTAEVVSRVVTLGGHPFDALVEMIADRVVAKLQSWGDQEAAATAAQEAEEQPEESPRARRSRRSAA